MFPATVSVAVRVAPVLFAAAANVALPESVATVSHGADPVMLQEQYEPPVEATVTNAVPPPAGIWTEPALTAKEQ